MAKFRITLLGSGGELESRIAANEEDARKVVLAIVSDLPYMAHGDRIVVTEMDDENYRENCTTG
jgi:hypothetical protein